MPLFECSRCKIIENTALGYYWLELRDAELQGRSPSPLCSQCKTGTWHGDFARKPSLGMMLASDGFLYSKTELLMEAKRFRQQKITVVKEIK